MAWVRIDDEFGDCPKVVKAGPLAAILQIRAACYASKHLSDGYVPSSLVPTLLHGFDRLRIGRTPALNIDWPAYMIDAGLWEATDGGFIIHDYLDYNPTKTEVLGRRAQRQASGQAGGRASAQARAQAKSKQTGSTDGSSKTQPPSPSPSESTPSVGSPEANAQSNASQLSYHRNRRHVIERATRSNGQRIWRCWGADGKSSGICAEGILEPGAVVA